MLKTLNKVDSILTREEWIFACRLNVTAPSIKQSKQKCVREIEIEIKKNNNNRELTLDHVRYRER